jgi:hypothetical protein
MVIKLSLCLAGGFFNEICLSMITKSKPFVKFFADFFYHDIALVKITKKFEDTLMLDEETKGLLMRLHY